jgi:hypothetical protein
MTPLQTHNVALLSPVADFVVQLGIDGRILSQGSLKKAMTRDRTLADEISRQARVLQSEKIESEKASEDKAAVEPKNGRLIVDEEVAVGQVGLKPGMTHHFP